MRHISLPVLVIIALFAGTVLAVSGTFDAIADLVSGRNVNKTLTLAVACTAYDVSARTDVHVDIYFRGTAKINSTPKLLIELRIASGTVKVVGNLYQIIWGEGELIQEKEDITIILEIKITPSYGGVIKTWHVEGTTTKNGNVLNLKTLQSIELELPTKTRFTKMHDLKLTQTHGIYDNTIRLS